MEVYNNLWEKNIINIHNISLYNNFISRVIKQINIFVYKIMLIDM